MRFPAGTRAGGMPFGVTLIGPAWSDESLLTCWVIACMALSTARFHVRLNRRTVPRAMFRWLYVARISRASRLTIN